MAAALPLEDQLCYSLYAASMAITRAYKPTLDMLGITYPQYLVLHTLWEEDGRTIGAIADRLALESSTVTPLVKRLEAAGHVERRRNPADERQVNVFLTDQGAAMRERCGCLGEALMERMALRMEQILRLKKDADMLRRSLGG
ncbi:MarR family winged helix-turn-helix transcriptional regulator [Sphingobium sp. CCH11-B1]|jgi:DNA-binding MarR family transcriptional regulator|uniref:MarR family winged helix-turn-helix transcriptional regulator n=1 Tax=Sphingobium sp. CCH11-B1 TaxID=1768781 RepID=UPI00083155C7|nr:MarR family transcriptional regulator [Sphingobium sp. CCH11-B1]MEA3390066.1 MarR family transcriptional regulator [Pseudomonadota bacterium]